jgi:hypothetical protein
MSAWIVSFSKWEKLMASSTAMTVGCTKDAALEGASSSVALACIATSLELHPAAFNPPKRH